jgi:ribosomal-protein-alanine N-acetyltransferase
VKENEPVVRIRPLCAQDVDAVYEMEKRCFAMPWSKESILHDLNENVCARYLVLTVDGVLAAYAGMWLIIDEAHMTNIAVHPDYRRRGYGEQILRALMALAQENLMGLMTLEVRRSNAAAQALYHKVGMIDVGYRKRYYEDNKEDALIMYIQFEYAPQEAPDAEEGTDGMPAHG